jgi:hypothetical protein
MQIVAYSEAGRLERDIHGLLFRCVRN